MNRISVVGSSGSGKTTAARAVAERLGYARLELDSVYHQADWAALPEDEFRSTTQDFVSRDQWVIDGNYHSQGVLDIVWKRADTVVWIDAPKHIVMSRVTKRTIRRALRREELWNGNREPMSNFTKWEPEDNVIRWAWTSFDSSRERYENRMNDTTWSHLDFIRLRSRHDVAAFINSLPAR
jgi:adenylate kinase family enzyme